MFQQYEGHKFIKAWVIGMSVDRIYDIFLGVYIMSWTGGHRFRVGLKKLSNVFTETIKFTIILILFQEMIYVIPESIVVAIYWVLNSFIFVSFSGLFYS